MAGNATEAQQAAEGQTPTEVDAKFVGFSAKDGEVQTTTAATVPGRVPSVSSPKVAAAAAPETPEDDGADGTPQHKSAQERINKAVAKQRAAERRATELEQRLAAVEARLTPPATQRNSQPAPPPDPSKYQGGEYDARYLADVARYHAAQAAREVTQQTRAESEQAAAAERQAAASVANDQRIGELIERGSAKYEDFEEVVRDPDVKLSKTLGELILDSEYGDEIAYAYASDPKEQRKVSAMSEARQAAWFGQKEFELSSRSTDAGGQKPQKVTQASPPMRHVAKGTGGTPKISAATPNFADFERMANGS